LALGAHRGAVVGEEARQHMEAAENLAEVNQFSLYRLHHCDLFHAENLSTILRKMF
jgi:hypothetical protein